MKIQNTLLFSLSHLSPLAYRLFLFLYSLPRDNTEVKTDLPAIRRALGLAEKHQNNQNIFAAIEELKGWITLRDLKTLKADYESATFPLFSSLSVTKQYRHILNFELSQKVLEIEKSGSFTPLSPAYLAKFKSVYSLRLFMLLNSYRKLAQRKLHLSHEQFCAALGADSKLKPSELKRRLKTAFIEIQASSASIWIGENDLNFDKRARVWIVEWQYEAGRKEPQAPRERDKTDWKNLKLNEFVALIRTMALTQTIKIPVSNGVLGVDRKGHLYNVNTGETFDKAKAGQLWRGLWEKREMVRNLLISTI